MNRGSVNFDPNDIRPSVLRLAEEMELKLLRDDQRKPDWYKESLGDLYEGLMREVMELVTSSPADCMREAADVANYAMMIAENKRREMTNRGRG